MSLGFLLAADGFLLVKVFFSDCSRDKEFDILGVLIRGKYGQARKSKTGTQFNVGRRFYCGVEQLQNLVEETKSRTMMRCIYLKKTLHNIKIL